MEEESKETKEVLEKEVRKLKKQNVRLLELLGVVTFKEDVSFRGKTFAEAEDEFEEMVRALLNE